MTEDWQTGRTERSPWLSPARGVGEPVDVPGGEYPAEYVAEPVTQSVAEAVTESVARAVPAPGPDVHDRQPYPATSPTIAYAVPAVPDFGSPDFSSPDLTATLPQPPALVTDDLPAADWTAAAAASRVATPVPAPALPQSPAPVPAPARPTDLMATQRVAVGTIQPRDPIPVTVEDAERVLALAVDAIHATPDMYAVGTPADGAVCLVPEDGRWSVYLADAGRRRFAGSFDDAELAAVHFAGVLLLLAQERGKLPRPALDDLPPGRSADPLAAFLAGPPIEPLAGDPPASLYAERRLTVLTPGTEVDRFGDLEGNTVYAARTLYPHRSLPAEFAEREYRVYRALGPVRVLTGRAVPWFGQPGGGTVYLLPRPIRDLIREGLLEEVPAATVAPV